MTARISECGYCHETQFTQWYSKSAPHDRHGRIDRDYLDSEPVAYCSEEHRDAADALAETVAREGALPMPAGPAPVPLSGPICSQAEARAAGLDIAPSVEELDAMAESVVALGDPLSAEVSLARAVPLLGAAVTGLRARVAELEAERHSTNEALDDAVQALRAVDAPGGTYPPALPWAALMDDEDRTEFLDELAESATVHASSDVVLAEVEKTCATWRLIAEAQHGHNTAPGPDAVTRAFSPVASLREPEPEPEFHGSLHHTYRVGHDLPETGGTR